MSPGVALILIGIAAAFLVSPWFLLLAALPVAITLVTK